MIAISLTLLTFKHDLQNVTCRSVNKFLKYLVLKGFGQVTINTLVGSILFSTFRPTFIVEPPALSCNKRFNS